MKQAIKVEFNDGVVATYVAAPPEWAKWEEKTGKNIGSVAETGLGIADLMFLAYCAMKRESAGKPVMSYEIWREGISEILPENTPSPKATAPKVSADS
jgi:hypothetical protein